MRRGGGGDGGGDLPSVLCLWESFACAGKSQS